MQIALPPPLDQVRQTVVYGAGVFQVPSFMKVTSRKEPRNVVVRAIWFAATCLIRQACLLGVPLPASLLRSYCEVMAPRTLARFRSIRLVEGENGAMLQRFLGRGVALITTVENEWSVRHQSIPLPLPDPDGGWEEGNWHAVM